MRKDQSTRLIQSYRVKGFRPFGAEVRLDGLGKVNIISGPNNVGKTALLLPLRRFTRMDISFVPKIGTPDGDGYYASLHHARFKAEDFRADSEPIEIHVRVNGRTLVDETQEGCATFLGDAWNDALIEKLTGLVQLKAVVGSSAFEDKPVDFSIAEVTKETLPGSGDLSRLATAFAFALSRRICCVTADRKQPSSLDEPDQTVNEERRFDGSELLHAVASLQLPKPEQASDHAFVVAEDRLRQPTKFERAAAEILGVNVCRVFVSLRRDGRTNARLLVAMGDEDARPLQDLGAGVAHVLTIAMAIAKAEGGIVIVEEPETGLHPATQRRLLKALLASDVQSLITTHSNHLLDVRSEHIQRYRLFQDSADGTRRVERLDTRGLEALWDLGVRPSSVAEANAIIWVEGPSDAIYIRYWLNQRAPGLIEGQDFTFAFSAGALLAHYTVEDSGHGGRVNLLAIHPGLFVVADRDREASDEPLKERLKRIQDSLPSDRLWITNGREIEGYITDALLLSSLRGGASDEQERPSEAGQIGSHATASVEKLQVRLKRLGCSWAGGKVALANKVLKAAAGCPWDECFTSELSGRMEILIHFIGQCQRATRPMAPPEGEEEEGGDAP